MRTEPVRGPPRGARARPGSPAHACACCSEHAAAPRRRPPRSPCCASGAFARSCILRAWQGCSEAVAGHRRAGRAQPGRRAANSWHPRGRAAAGAYYSDAIVACARWRPGKDRASDSNWQLAPIHAGAANGADGSGAVRRDGGSSGLSGAVVRAAARVRRGLLLLALCCHTCFLPNSTCHLNPPA